MPTTAIRPSRSGRPRRRLRAALAALSVAALASACSSSGGAAGSPSKVSLPVIEMLTGPVSYYGQIFMNGAEVAVEQINAAGGIGGKKIDLEKVDNASTDAQTVSLLRKYCADRSVGLLVAPTYQTNSDAGGPVSNACGLPTITGVGDIDAGTNPHGYMFKNTTVRQPDQIENTLAFALGRAPTSSVGQITDTSVGPYVLYKNVGSKYLSAKKIHEVDESANGSLGSYAPQITALKTANPGLVVVTLQPADAAHFIEQARGQGLKSTFVATCGCLSDPTVYAKSHGAAAGLITSAPWAPPEKATTLMPSFARFVAAYGKKYGAVTDPEGVYTYDSVMLAKTVIEKAGSSTDRSKLKAALQTLPRFCAAMCYRNDGHGSFVTTSLYFSALTKDGFDVLAHH